MVYLNVKNKLNLNSNWNNDSELIIKYVEISLSRTWQQEMKEDTKRFCNLIEFSKLSNRA
jgi:hypothetical protein